MKITFTTINGIKIPKLRGGRITRIIPDKKKTYRRNKSSWKKEI